MNTEKEATLHNLCGKLGGGTHYMMCRHLPCVAFPRQIAHTTPEQALGELIERLLTTFFVAITETFPNENVVWQNPAQAEGVEQYRSYFRTEATLNLLFAKSQSQIPERSQVAAIIAQAALLPEPPYWFPNLLKNIHNLIIRLSEVYANPDKIAWNLFIGMTQIYEMMVIPEQKLPSRETMMMFLNAYTHQQLSRISAGRKRRLEWGKEVDEHYRQELAKGLNKKIALIISREHFRKKHPIMAPEDAEDVAPGLTSASLLKYHREYLASLKQA